MTVQEKQDIISQVVAILNTTLQTTSDTPVPTTSVKEEVPEMLTIKECTELVKGVSEHTIRRLALRDEIPYIRTGEGKHGKMLINKAILLEYFVGKK